MKSQTLCIIGLLLLIAACTTSQGNTAMNFQEIYKGKEGIKTEVVEKALPSNTFENENFDLILKVTNKGPIAANPKVIVITEKPYLTFSDGQTTFQSRNIQLEGKEMFKTLDDFKVEVFNLKAKQIDPLSETHDALIIISTCYDYSSKSFSDVCIDTDPYNLKPIEKTCSIKDISLSEGQGGPLMISKVEPRMLIEGESVKPQFKIYIENHGSGSITKYGNSNKICSNQPKTAEDYNLLSTSSLNLELGGFKRADFDCIPEDIQLKGKQDYILCTLKPGKIQKDIDPYTTTLKIELEYGYTVSETRQVTIEKALTH